MAQALSSNIPGVPWHNAPRMVVGISCGAAPAQDGFVAASPCRVRIFSRFLRLFAAIRRKLLSINNLQLKSCFPMKVNQG
jgi:hypothetical protein